MNGEEISPENIEEVMQVDDYDTFVAQMESKVHDTIPFGIGGDFETFTAPYGKFIVSFYFVCCICLLDFPTSNFRFSPQKSNETLFNNVHRSTVLPTSHTTRSTLVVGNNATRRI